MNETARRRVAVVTDSTADLPPELVEQYDIHVVPQILIMGDSTWQDGVDIDSATFYELLRTSPDFPSTSQPSVATFYKLFVQLSKDVEGIAAVLVSGKLSGTLNSALTAATNLPDVPIEIIDTRAASMQLGFAVLVAARAAAANQDLETVADAARAMIGGTGVYFVVDTLEYLHRGGRIGAAARLFGSALNLKPVLEIKDGLVQPLATIRTRRKALEKLYQLLEKQLPQEGQVHIAIVHVAAPQEASRLAEELETRFQPVEIIRSECGPVVGAHVGPGTVGVAFYVE
ncbi:MAG: DegV family protein [Anaerolineae bacterium]